MSDPAAGLESEELILRNTYINAMLLPAMVSGGGKGPKKGKPLGVRWADSKSETKQQVATVITDEKTGPELEQVVAHRNISQRSLKPIMKASLPQSEPFVPASMPLSGAKGRLPRTQEEMEEESKGGAQRSPYMPAGVREAFCDAPEDGSRYAFVGPLGGQLKYGAGGMMKVKREATNG